MPRLATRLRVLILTAACLTLASACSTARSSPTTATPRPAIDVPDHFVVGSWESSETTEPFGSATCSSPMVDPRDGTLLRLVRSNAGEGDYEVPEARFGVGPGEALRLECRTGRVIGIVGRKD